MSKTFKTILITSIAVFGAVFLLTPLTFAEANDNLVVQFEQAPLFYEANFLPGEGITRWVKVTNNSGQSQRIAVQAINVSDPDRLGDVLNLEIKEGEITRYSNDLTRFFDGGEVFLSELGSGSQTQYDFAVSFYSGAGNTFQEKNLGFDILIGFQGTEGGILPGAGSGGGGGGGGGLPAGLTIQDQSVKITDIGETSVTITWLTSYHSTSQVVYGKAGESHTLDLTDTSGSPPKYGYAHTTPEYDISSKVTFHSVTITGLTPGTTYYYRTISHASLAISQEYNFSTLAAKQEQGAVGPETGTAGLTGQEIGAGALAGTAPAPSGGIIAGAAVAATGEIGAGTEGGQAQAETTKETAVGQTKESTEQKEISGNIFGAISGFLGRGWIVITIIFLLALAVLFFLRQRKQKRARQF